MATHANRSDLPTPGWRMLHLTDLKSMVRSQDLHLSDDSEDDETFIRSNQTISTEERERWAGFSIKKQSAATKGSQSRSKRNRGGKPRTTEAVFPTPMESFLLVHQAKSLYLDLQRESAPGDEANNAEMRRNLANFMDSLETFAAIEDCLQKQKANMTRLLAVRKTNGQESVPRRSSVAGPSGSHFLDGASSNVDGAVDGEMLTKRRKMNSSIASGPNENFLYSSATNMSATLFKEKSNAKQALDVAIMELAITRLEMIEKSFSDNSSTLFNALRDLLEQTDLKAPSTRSFASLMKKFREASNRAANQSSAGSKAQRLSELIKGQIDAGRYPVIAQTFKLSEDYRLDGCDPCKGWRNEKRELDNANGVHKMKDKCEETPESQPKQAPANPSKDKLKSFGFSLDADALGSDEEGDNAIVNPLHGEAWHDVRMRLERKRKRATSRRRQGHTDFEDGLPILPVAPDVEINISVHSTPSSIAETRRDHLHPGDRAILDDLPAQEGDQNRVVRRIVEFDGDDLIPLPDDQQIPPEDDSQVVIPIGFPSVSDVAGSSSPSDELVQHASVAVEQPSEAQSTHAGQSTIRLDDPNQTQLDIETTATDPVRQNGTRVLQRHNRTKVDKSPQPVLDAQEKHLSLNASSSIAVEIEQDLVKTEHSKPTPRTSDFASEEEEVLDSNDAYNSHGGKEFEAFCEDAREAEYRLEDSVVHARDEVAMSPIPRNTPCAASRALDSDAVGVAAD